MMTSGAEFRISSISCDCSILTLLFFGPVPVNVRKLAEADDGAGNGVSYLHGCSYVQTTPGDVVSNRFGVIDAIRCRSQVDCMGISCCTPMPSYAVLSSGLQPNVENLYVPGGCVCDAGNLVLLLIPLPAIELLRNKFFFLQ